MASRRDAEPDEDREHGTRRSTEGDMESRQPRVRVAPLERRPDAAPGDAGSGGNESTHTHTQPTSSTTPPAGVRLDPHRDPSERRTSRGSHGPSRSTGRGSSTAMVGRCHAARSLIQKYVASAAGLVDGATLRRRHTGAQCRSRHSGMRSRCTSWNRAHGGHSHRQPSRKAATGPHPGVAPAMRPRRFER